MNRAIARRVLDCGGWRGTGLAPLWSDAPATSTEPNLKAVCAPSTSPTAVQDAVAPAYALAGSWPQCAIRESSKLSMNLRVQSCNLLLQVKQKVAWHPRIPGAIEPRWPGGLEIRATTERFMVSASVISVPSKAVKNQKTKSPDIPPPFIPLPASRSELALCLHCGSGSRRRVQQPHLALRERHFDAAIAEFLDNGLVNLARGRAVIRHVHPRLHVNVNG